MAGKFLTLDEAAAALGVSAEDVQKLVDRKELFPIRDGGTLKFRGDEIERRKQDSGEVASWEQTTGLAGDLSLDLDSEPAMGSAVPPKPAADGNLDEPLALDDLDLDSEPAMGSAAPPKPAADVNLDEPLALDDLDLDDAPQAGRSDDLQGEAIELADDLALSGGDSLLAGASDDIDSIIASGVAGPPDVTPPPAMKGSTDDLDLGNLDGSDLVLDDLEVDGFGSGSLSDKAGLAASGESGLELGDGSLEISGIELGDSNIGSGSASGDGLEFGSGISDVELFENANGLEGTDDEIDPVFISAGDSVDEGGGGDDFDLGSPIDGADESASQILELTSESGESSFFNNFDEDGSSFGGDSGLESFPGSSLESGLIGNIDVPEMRFSGWQIAGLICMTLLMLFGAFSAYDLVRTIGSSEPVGTPILDALAKTIGWR